MKADLIEYKLRALAATKSKTTRLDASEARRLLKLLDDLRLRALLAEAKSETPVLSRRRGRPPKSSASG